MEFDTVLPGHGDAFTGKAKIEHRPAYLRDLWTQAPATHSARIAVEEASKRIDLGAHASNNPTLT